MNREETDKLIAVTFEHAPLREGLHMWNQFRWSRAFPFAKTLEAKTSHKLCIAASFMMSVITNKTRKDGFASSYNFIKRYSVGFEPWQRNASYADSCFRSEMYNLRACIIKYDLIPCAIHKQIQSKITVCKSLIETNSILIGKIGTLNQEMRAMHRPYEEEIRGLKEEIMTIKAGWKTGCIVHVPGAQRGLYIKGGG